MKLFFLGILIACNGVSFAAENAQKDKTIRIKWVLAHEPIELFKIAADSFIKEVTEKTNGGVQFELMSLPEYQAKYNDNKKIPLRRFLAKVQDSSIEMSQTYTTELARLNKLMYVLDLPFLFRDHSHAQKVLEGKVGEKLLAGLAPQNIHGLAFTYSGGYRILPGVKKITRVEDFKGLKIRVSSSPVAKDTFQILGAETFALPLDEINRGIQSGKINEAESTYARFFPMDQNKAVNIVNETNHSLFLTSIIMNKQFWDKLPENYKTIMKNAAIVAARLEREHSVKAGIEIKEKCLKEGVQIYTMNKAEENRMKQILSPIYDKYKAILGDELITSVVTQ